MKKIYCSLLSVCKSRLLLSTENFAKFSILFLLICLVSPFALAEMGHKNKEKQTIPFSIARLIIVFNATDLDAGVQVFLDGG